MPDISFARRKIESFMTDAIVFRWDREGSQDDTIDYDTGEAVRPASDTTAVYDETSVGAPTDEFPDGRPLGHPDGLGGICFVDPAEAVRSVSLQIAGSANVTSVPYALWLPIDAPELGPGAVGEVIFSKEDPWLIGKEFVIAHVTGGSLEPMRIAICQERGAIVPG